MQVCERCFHNASVGSISQSMLFKRTDDRIFYAEHDIGIEILVPGGEDMGNKRLVMRCPHHEMNMSRSIRMTTLCLEHLADRSVVWNRIGCRPDCPEVEVSVIVGMKP